MQKSGLTERKMSNKRFLKTEKAIFIAYCRLQDYPSAKRVAKIARISRSTLYRHHKIVQNIPQDYEKYLIHLYRKRFKKYLSRTHPDLRLLFLRTLIFIYNYRQIFLALFREERKDVIMKMLDYLRPEVTLAWHKKRIPDKIYNVYKNEIVGIIETWAQNNFSKQRTDIALDNIMFLTQSAPQRLFKLKL